MLYICTRNQQMNGALVQLVRIRACHARGQGFESPTHRRRDDLKVFSFFVHRGLVQLVAPRLTCLRCGMSVGELLRNYKSCVYSQKSK